MTLKWGIYIGDTLIEACPYKWDAKWRSRFYRKFFDKHELKVRRRHDI